ncbi:MAG: hypothetical protein IKG21_00820 [Atopobiaceae bacterium]|nr:hypothetical protein [Atopobiaceae bacterium]
MAGYRFGPNERVVLKAQDVKIDGDSKPFSSMSGSELILTNENIVYPRKGMFGKIKGYNVYPLSSIRIVDGTPQCRLDSSEFMEHKLEISFQDELVSFVFGSLDAKKEVRAWVNEISTMLVGHGASEENLRATGAGAFSDIDAVAETFGDLMSAFDNALARKRAKTAPVIACRCPSCNASVTGKLGTTVKCPYCDSDVTIA